MELKKLVYAANSTTAIFYTSSSNGTLSSKLTIAGLVKVQVKFDILTNPCYINKYIKFTKLNKDDKIMYVIYVSYSDNSCNVILNNDDGLWQHLDQHGVRELAITFELDIIPVSPHESLKALYEDMDSADFELRGKDGSVRMHRMMMWPFSPVFRTMLTGPWKEAAEGTVDLKDVTMATLEHLKDFLYLHKLPEDGFLPLLELAAYYMLPDLLQYCSIKLLLSLSKDDFCDLMQIALKYKLKNLYLGLLRQYNTMITDRSMVAYLALQDWV